MRSLLKINLRYIIGFQSTGDSYILDHQQCYHFFRVRQLQAAIAFLSTLDDGGLGGRILLSSVL